jgi:hypothetical protein
MKTTTAVLVYLSFPLLLFWWGWFEWWVALPCTAALIAVFWKTGGFEKPISTPKTLSSPLLICFALAFVWTYLAGVGGFRPQHFDYFKHNLMINNLVRYEWPVRYSEGTYLCYYPAYYLPAALLAKWIGGISAVHFYIFGWTWLGLTLLFQLLHRLGGWTLVVLFIFFNSPEAILLMYEAFKSPHTIGYTLADLWTNDHTIELIQTPGGLMFPSHVESFTAAPQHALPAWLATGVLLECRVQSAKCRVSIAKCQSNNEFTVYCLLFTVLLYWSPLVAVGLLPFIIYHLIAGNKELWRPKQGLSLFRSPFSIFLFPLHTLISLPALIFYAGHVPLHDIQGWWWTFLETPHEYVLLATFLLIEIGFWGLLMWFLKKKNTISKEDFRLVLFALAVLLGLALYRYGHFNDLARRASLPAALMLCWGIGKGVNSHKRTGIFTKIIIGSFLFICGLLPLKHHLRWLTKQPYTAIVDKKISDFTPYPIHYLSRYHWGEFDVVAQYLGKANSWYLCYFAPKLPQKPKQITRAFYYWKSTFELSDYEKAALKKYGATRLYIKFFDVDWDAATRQAIPKAVIHFKENPPLEFIPTVFITNRTLEKLSWGGVDELANKISEKIGQIHRQQIQAELPRLNNSAEFSRSKLQIKELQIDCDWTVQTRVKYFRLLNKLKERLTKKHNHFAYEIQLSATIRLHQIKFYRTTGLPPVERGMLMYYNMDDWKNIRTQNSILDLTVAGRYADYISDYPLPLDVVLPIFNWAVIYRNGKFIAFINHLNHKDLEENKTFKKASQTNQYIALCDTLFRGLSIRRGDRLRIEESTVKNLKISGKTLVQEIQNTKVTFALYHLDSLNLSYYEKDSLQQVFQTFH